MDDKKIKLNTNVKFAIKILTAIVISYYFFEKNYLNVSVLLLVLIQITRSLKNDNYVLKNKRIVERVCDIFVFLGYGFTGLANITLGVISFIVVVFVGYIPFFWAKRAHIPRYIILFISLLGYQLNVPYIIDFALILCILITFAYLFKNKNMKYIFK